MIPRPPVSPPIPQLCLRGGCTAEATGKYCTRRCAAVARIGAGWHPEAALLRPDVRLRACRNGAKACAAIVRRRRATAILARLRPLLGHRAFQGLDGEQQAAVMALAGKAYRIGTADGYQRGWKSKNTPGLKRPAA